MPRADHEFGEIRISSADWPILLVEFPEKRVADADLRGVLQQLESFMKEAVADREKVFTITDLTRMRDFAPASQRKLTADWSHEKSGLAAAAALGAAFVAPSPILRGIITAVLWVRPTPRPTIFVATRREAMLKGIELYEASKVPLSPRLVAYRDEHRTRRAV